jgi:hypothetical protein
VTGAAKHADSGDVKLETDVDVDGTLGMLGREYGTRHADAKGCCPSRIRSGDDAVGIHLAGGMGGERSERGFGQRE